MAVNFCNERLDVKISCNQLCADNYSVNNLISNNPNIRRNGFRTEYFIRPPIEITFVSQITFDIMCIEIGLKSNEHKTNGIEIYSSRTDEKEFNFLVKHFTDSDVINVKNVCFRPNGKLSRLPTHKLIDNNCEHIVIGSRLMKNCYQTKQIRIKILKTTNSSVPSLSFLNIWGQPVRNTSQLIINKIIDLKFSETKNSTEIQFYDKSQTNELIKDTKKRSFSQISTKNELNDSLVSIPPEFIDLITNDIMVLPVLLPSGKCIDKSTLDKYVENESVWGRTPNDPFTSLPFTRDRHPIPNNILKIRIDRFLSDNHEIIGTENISSKRIAGYSELSIHTNGLIISRLVDTNKQQIPVNNSQIKEDICSECKCIVKYKLLCNHIICRNQWLIKFNDKQFTKYCNLCYTKISSDDIVRVQKLSQSSLL